MDLMSQYGPYTNYEGTNDGGTVFLLETPYCKDFRDASAAMESPAYHDARCLHELNILILYLTFCAFAKNIPSKKISYREFLICKQIKNNYSKSVK